MLTIIISESTYFHDHSRHTIALKSLNSLPYAPILGHSMLTGRLKGIGWILFRKTKWLTSICVSCFRNKSYFAWNHFERFGDNIFPIFGDVCSREMRHFYWNQLYSLVADLFPYSYEADCKQEHLMKSEKKIAL